jgi:hypothetical protein
MPNYTKKSAAPSASGDLVLHPLTVTSLLQETDHVPGAGGTSLSLTNSETQEPPPPPSAARIDLLHMRIPGEVEEPPAVGLSLTPTPTALPTTPGTTAPGVGIEPPFPSTPPIG